MQYILILKGKVGAHVSVENMTKECILQPKPFITTIYFYQEFDTILHFFKCTTFVRSHTNLICKYYQYLYSRCII